MKTMPGFEFCAFRFLIQWQEDEQKLHAAISSSTPAATDIRGALSYFQVARNFRDLDQPEKTAFVLNSLLEVRADQTLQTPGAKVARLTQRLQEEFDQDNLLAASKLLWLSYREPYIVYDGRAVTALIRDLGYRFPPVIIRNTRSHGARNTKNTRILLRKPSNTFPKPECSCGLCHLRTSSFSRWRESHGSKSGF